MEQKSVKFSKGEWWNDGLEIGVGPRMDIKICNRVSGATLEEAKANVKLITRAPKMLALLKSISTNNWIPQQIDDEIKEADETWNPEENHSNETYSCFASMIEDDERTGFKKGYSWQPKGFYYQGKNVVLVGDVYFNNTVRISIPKQKVKISIKK